MFHQVKRKEWKNKWKNISPKGDAKRDDVLERDKTRDMALKAEIL